MRCGVNGWTLPSITLTLRGGQRRGMGRLIINQNMSRLNHGLEVQAGLRGEREASGRAEVRVAHVVSRTEVDYSGGERTEFLQASNETATCYFDRLMYFSIVEI